VAIPGGVISGQCCLLLLLPLNISFEKGTHVLCVARRQSRTFSSPRSSNPAA